MVFKCYCTDGVYGSGLRSCTVASASPGVAYYAFILLNEQKFLCADIMHVIVMECKFEKINVRWLRAAWRLYRLWCIAHTGVLRTGLIFLVREVDLTPELLLGYSKNGLITGYTYPRSLSNISIAVQLLFLVRPILMIALLKNCLNIRLPLRMQPRNPSFSCTNEISVLILAFEPAISD